MPLQTLLERRAGGDRRGVPQFSSAQLATIRMPCHPPHRSRRALLTQRAPASKPTSAALLRQRHTLLRAWDGQPVRQYVDGLRANTVAMTATGGWTIYRWGWQFIGSEGLDEAYVPARSVPPGTMPWLPAGAPIPAARCCRRWMGRW